MSWFNADGLLVRFGSEKVQVTQGGEYQGAGALRVIEFELDVSKVPATTGTIQFEDIIIPRNFTIEKVEIYTETAWNNLTSVSVGLIRFDRSTAISTTALVAAGTTEFTTAGVEVTLVKNSTHFGASIGTTLAQPGLITAFYSGTAPTTGHSVVRVHGFVANQEPVANEQNF